MGEYADDVQVWCPNLQDMLEREVARSKRAGMPFDVAFVSLHNLKAIEARQGDRLTEQLLRIIEDAFRYVLRRYDFVAQCRTGEFGLIFALPIEAHPPVSRRIENGLASVAQAQNLSIQIRIGAARCPHDGTSADGLMAIAYVRMVESDDIINVSPR